MSSSRVVFGLAGLLLIGCSGAQSPPPAVVSEDGIDIAYSIHGPEGPAVVLVHGWGNNQTFFDPNIPSLSQSHRIVTLDLVGFGDSGQDRSAWTMEAFGQDVVAVVDALELDRPVLVGFSMGGAAVLEAAASLGRRVSGVVLVDVFKDVNARTDAESREAAANGMKSIWHTEEGFRAMIGPGAPDSLVQMALEKTPVDPPEYWWDVLEDVFRWSDSDLIPTVQAVDVPIAAVNAAAPPTDVEAFRTYAPSFEVTTIPDVGHLGILWSKPEAFAEALLAFVESMSSDSGR